MIKGGVWTLVDVREPGAPAVLFRNGSARPRTSLSRALADAVGTRRARALASAIDDWASTATSSSPDLVVDGARVRPVPGPGGAVHAAWTWADDARTSDPPFALSLEWDARTRMFAIPAAAGGLAGRPEFEVRESGVTTHDAFRFVEVDDTLGLAQAILARTPREWTGTATLRRPDGAVPVVADLLPIAGTRKLSGVVFEVPGTPASRPVESVAMSTVSQLSNIHVLVMDVLKMRVLRWLTDPPPGVAWKGQRDNRDTPHPDDVRRIFEQATSVFRGETNRMALNGVRLRRLVGGWLIVDAAGELVEGSDPPMLIVQMIERGTSDEPDPVPEGDQGHPGR